VTWEEVSARTRMGKASGACQTRSGLARGQPSPRTEEAPNAARNSELGKRGSQTIWGFLGRGMAGPLAGIHRHRRLSSRAARRAGGCKLMGLAILVMFVMQGCLPVSESMPDTGGRMNPQRGDSGTVSPHHDSNPPAPVCTHMCLATPGLLPSR
jgi:hypothetical protein